MQTDDSATPPETVHGHSDGSTYTAVLARTATGGYAVVQLLVDGHLIPVKEAEWPEREDALRAVADYARGDRNPYRA